MTELVNLTAHAVTVHGGAGIAVTVQPAGPVARVREQVGPGSPLETPGGAVVLRAVAYGVEVDDLPSPRPGVLYLVSRITAAAVPRGDLVFPHGETRDAYGRITGCEALGFFSTRDEGGSA